MRAGLQLGLRPDRLRRACAGGHGQDIDCGGRKVRIGSWGGAALAVVGMLALSAAGAGAEQAKSQVFKSWSLDCATPKPAQGSTSKPRTVCLIHHEVADANDATKVQLSARARYFGTERKPYFILLLPPASNLQKGVRLEVDKGTVYGAKIELCDQHACTCRFPLTDDVLKQFKSGTDLNLTYLINPQSVIKTTVPLAGFGAALDALQKTGS
jgi:invasion protein IalB